MKTLLRRLWSAMRWSRVHADVAEELEFHRAMKQRELEDDGHTSRNAASATRRALGSVALAQDQVHDVWCPRWLQGLIPDLRLAVRTLAATKVVTTVAVLSLALGIGANTAMFSIVNSLLLRALPVTDPDGLVLLTDAAAAPHGGVGVWTYAIWDEIHQRGLFDATAAWSYTRFNLATGGEKHLINGFWASGSFFDTFGVPAFRGRVLSETDDRQGGGPDGAVAVISYGFWQRQFASAPDIAGRALRLDGVRFTIVGVTPPDFFGPEVGRTFDVIAPLGDEPLIRGRETYLANTGTSFLTIVGRLGLGQTPDAVLARLRSVQAQIREATVGDTLPKAGPQAVRRYLAKPFAFVPAATGYSELRGRYTRPLMTMMVVVVLLLLIACVNIANLLLARARARRHELSLRLALGASRWRLVRQLFMESLVLATLGAALATMLALWMSPWLVHQLSTPNNPVFLDLSIDRRVLAFTMGITALATLLAGTAPGFRVSQVAPMDALKQQGRLVAGHRSSIGTGLVIAQVALSVVLVVAAGLFIRTFAALASRPLGFDPGRVVIVTLDAQRTTIDAAQRVPVYAQVVEAVRALPDVDDAAISLVTPFSNAFTPPVEVTGVPQADYFMEVFGNLVSPDWFQTFRIPTVAGRGLTQDDQPGAPRVAVVNQTFVRKFFGTQNPLGRTITLFPHSPMALPPIEIVGVVADAVYGSLRGPVPPTWYVPFRQFDLPEFPLSSADLSVRARTPPSSMFTKRLTDAITAVNPQLAVTFRPMADRVTASMTQERVVAQLAAGFAGLALLLAGLGLYGVTAYAVSQRRVELGIRMALGAHPATVIRLVLTRVMGLVAMGIIAGALLSAWASRFVATLVYGLAPRDPLTLVTSAIILGGVASIAAGVPAWRASRLDPATTLRYE